MTDPNVLKALDCLYGAVESLQVYLVWKDKSSEDLRDAGNALNQAQDAISALRDEAEDVYERKECCGCGMLVEARFDECPHCRGDYFRPKQKHPMHGSL